MQSTLTWKNAVENMETLIQELHKEWESSGVSEAAVVIAAGRMKGLNQCLKQSVMEKKSVLETSLTFEQSLSLTKESFVLLRLIKKVRNAEESQEAAGMCPEYIISLDHEEYELYQKMRSE